MTFILATTSPRHYIGMPDRLEKRTGEAFVFVSRREELTVEALTRLSPTAVFFPHWSFLIPPEIHEGFTCILFHMTDLPFGRGGSPLQNLIARGHTDTVMSAFRCVKELDAGPVYLKRPLPLAGSAEEIFARAAVLIEDMIVTLARDNPTPTPQTGELTVFKRRLPEQSDLAGISAAKTVYDHIRMLDADGYPRAFLRTSQLMLEFSQAKFVDDAVTATVRITAPKGAE